MPEPLLYRVPHSQVDALAEWRMSGLLGLLEQAAIEASTDVGLGPAWYARARRTWIVRRTRVERRLPVGGGDLLEVQTRVLDWRRARSLRRYEVRLHAPGRDTRIAAPPLEPDGSAPLVAVAVTDWVFYDTASRRPASIPEEVCQAFAGDHPVENMARATAPAAPGGAATTRTLVRVRPSHVDHLGHPNNAVWAEFLEDAARDLLGVRTVTGTPADDDEGGATPRLTALDVEYLGDAAVGDEVEIESGSTGDLGIAQQARRGSTRLVRAASLWGRARRSTILGGPPGT